MTEKTINVCKKFTHTEFSSSNANTIYDLYSVSNPVEDRNYTGFLTDLRIKIECPNLVETSLPDIKLGVSNSAKAEAIRDYEWDSERFELEFLLKVGETDYQPLFSISAKNNPPYLVKDLLGYLTSNPAFALGYGNKLGIRCKDVGYGYPQSGDNFVVYGVIREELEPVTNETLISNLSNQVDSLALLVESQKIKVGGLYLSTDSANPGTSLGYGTWENYAVGRALVGVDENDNDFNEPGKTFGSKTHTLTVEEMPSHTHTVGIGIDSGADANQYWLDGPNPRNTANYTTASAGLGTAHNNMQPSIAIHIFRRIA